MRTTLTVDEVKQLAFNLFQPNIIKFFTAIDHKPELFIKFMAGLNETDQKYLKIFHSVGSSILGKGRGGYGEVGFAKNYQELITDVQRQVREELSESKDRLSVKNIDNLYNIFVRSNIGNCFDQMFEILTTRDFIDFTFSLYNNLGILTKLADDLDRFLPKKIVMTDSKKDQKQIDSQSTRLTAEEKLLILELPRHFDEKNCRRAVMERGYTAEAISRLDQKICSVMAVIFEPEIIRLLYASFGKPQIFDYYLRSVSNNQRLQALLDIFDNNQFNILYGKHPFVQKFRFAMDKLVSASQTALLAEKKPCTAENIEKRVEYYLQHDIKECQSSLEFELTKILIQSPVILATLLSNLDNLRAIAADFDQFSRSVVITLNRQDSGVREEKLTSAEKFLLNDMRKADQMEMKQQEGYLLKWHPIDLINKLNKKIELLIDNILEVKFFKNLYSKCCVSNSVITDKTFAQSFCKFYESIRRKACEALVKGGAVDLSSQKIDLEMEKILKGPGIARATQKNALRKILILADDRILNMLLAHFQKRSSPKISSSSITMIPAGMGTKPPAIPAQLTLAKR